jgi:hypothetical protein
MAALDITKGASLYVVLAPNGITVETNAGASWHAPAGSFVTLDPAAQKTAMNLQQNLIGFAPPGAVDNTTPVNILRGQIGMRTALRNA